VIAVHDTKESWERFREEILTDIAGGLAGPPQETAFETHTLSK